MKKYLINFLCVMILLAGSFTNASAALIGSFTHDYGKGVGKVDPGGSDVLRNDYVLVKDNSVPRFEDSFNYSNLNYEDGSIEKFILTLTFSYTNNSVLWFEAEDWKVRPGGSTTLLDIDRVGSSQTTQQFTIQNNFETFESLNDGLFYFWLAEEAGSRTTLDYTMPNLKFMVRLQPFQYPPQFGFSVQA